MKMTLYALASSILVTLACGSSNVAPSLVPTNDPNIIQTVIVSTALAAQNQTQIANVPIATPIPTDTMLPANTPIITENPSSPLSLTYEGLSASCICNACSCLTNIVFTVRVTIDSQGNVTGILEKYTPDAPAINLEGTKENIHGLFQEENEKLEFIGSISDNFSTLEGAFSFEGINPIDDSFTFSGQPYSGKRTMILFKK